MIFYYLGTSVVMFLILQVFIWRDDDNKISVQSKSINLMMCIANLGYLAVAASTNIEEAILANKITYFGGCFLPPMVFFFMCTFCNFKIKKWVRIFLYLYSAIVFVMTLTVGFSDIYYLETHIEKYSGTSKLVSTYGVGHTFFTILLSGYIIADFVISVIAFVKKTVSQKTLFILIVLQLTTINSFFIGRMINPLIEIMPAVYVIDGILFILLNVKLSKYNLTDNIISTIIQNNTSGFALFDKKYRYLGCNDKMFEILPDIKSCIIDKKIDNPKLKQFFYTSLDDFNNNKKTLQSIWNNDKYYEVSVKDIIRNGIKRGYLLEFQEHTDRKKYMDLLTGYNNELKEEVEKKTKHIEEIQNKIILGMGDMVENRDDNTGGHVKRTSDVVRILTEIIKSNNLLDLSNEFFDDLIKAAPMHDLGKIGIDDNILKKPGKFTDEEFEIMKTHTQKSADICESILRGVEEDHFVNIAVNVARFHHEKWNGQGYPFGLKEKEIPIEARIMAIADVYDALVSKRCYKEPMSFEKAKEIMLESMGSHFDPNLEQIFLLSLPRLESYYMGDMGGLKGENREKALI